MDDTDRTDQFKTIPQGRISHPCDPWFIFNHPPPITLQPTQTIFESRLASRSSAGLRS
jgi:hypothetical protein